MKNPWNIPKPKANIYRQIPYIPKGFWRLLVKTLQFFSLKRSLYHYYLPLLMLMLLILPLAGVFSGFQMMFATNILTKGILCVSFNLLFYHGGMLPIGHSLFFGLAGYATAIFAKATGWPLLALCVGPIFAGLAAFSLGSFVVRLDNIFFAMMSLIFAQVGLMLIFAGYAVTGGENGLTGFIPGDSFLQNETLRFSLIATIALVAIHTMWLISRSPFFGIFAGIRENYHRAQFIGVDIHKHKWLAFTIAGFFAGVAGSLAALSTDAITPSAISLLRVFEILVIILLGGVNIFFGPLLGAVVIAVSTHYFAIEWPLFWPLALGLVIMGLVLFKPDGLSGWLYLRLMKWVRR